MALKYNKPKRLRIKSRFIGATSVNGNNLWFNTTLNKWEDRNETGWSNEYGFSSHAPCKTVKAFRKMLSKLPPKFELRLVSRYVGYDVIGRGGKSLIGKNAIDVGYCIPCYHMMMADGDDDDEDDFQECSECDGHDACRDFGCAIKAGLGHIWCMSSKICEH